MGSGAAADFEAIVVGGGLSGLACAYTLARGGAGVLVVERGEYSGAKNVMGGVIYHRPTEEVFPGFAAEAPLERKVVRQDYWLMTADAAVRAGYEGGDWRRQPNAYTVLRARFDNWLAEKCRQAGALILTETTATELISQKGRVIGIRTSRPQGELYAPVTVIAQGINRMLLEKAGLAGPLDPREAALGVKEVIALPGDVIEERFNLGEGEGATIEMIGDATEGLVGAGFLYTNRESVSLGLGVLVHRMVERRVNPNELLERLKRHPLVRPLIAGGESREYLAHLIPEGGYRSVPRLAGDGYVVVGDAAMLCNGLHREGSNLAMISGRLAALAILEARRRGDFSAGGLAPYPRELGRSFVIRDLRKYRNANQFFDENPHIFTLYPRLAAGVAERFATVDGVPKKEKQAAIWGMVRRERSGRKLVRDAYRAWRALG